MYTLVVREYGFVCALEAGKPQQILRILCEFPFREQYCRSVVKNPIFKNIQLFEYSRNLIAGCFRQTPAFYAQAHCLPDFLLVQVRKFQFRIRVCFPTMPGFFPLKKKFIVFALRHSGRYAFHPAVYGIGDVSFCRVRHFLTDDFFLVIDAEQYCPAILIQKGAQCFHSSFQLTGSFLILNRICFCIRDYQFVYVIQCLYVHLPILVSDIQK